MAHNYILLFVIFISVFCSGINCRSNGNFNLSIVEGYLSNFPKDGLSFFKRFSQSLEEDKDECSEQVDVLLNQRQDQAIRMFDAWSKIPSGILWSSTLDLGTYDECMDVDFQEKKIRVMGKHCAYGLAIPYTTDPTMIMLESFRFSYCIPNKCNKTHIVKALGLQGETEKWISDKYCTVKGNRSEWTTADILVATLMVFIMLLMILSTLYDVYLYYSDEKPAHPLYLSFSLYSNGKKLFQVSSNKTSSEQILVFHGLKFIGMCWIIAGHNGVAYEVLPIDNFYEAANYLRTYYTAYLQTAHLAVDSFFFISGFLLAYLYFKSEAQKPASKQLMTIPYLILHRYLRLTPALVIIYLTVVFLLPHLQTGPLVSGSIEDGLAPCKSHWWAVFLYIQNYTNRKNLCMTNLWYVAADMQLFVFAPFILIPLAVQYNKKQYKLVMTELTVLSVFSALVPVFTKLQWRGFDPNFDEYDTHSRIVDYVMGITLAVFIRCGNYNPNRITPIFNVILWILTLSAMFCGVVLNETAFLSNDYVHKTICLSIMRPLWCAGLSYVIWACYNGRGGIINWFLSCAVMQVGSKLTYAIYLVHGNVLTYWAYNIREHLHVNDFLMFYTFCGGLVTSLIISTFVSLGFESPMIVIERFLFKKAPRPPPKQQATQN